MSFSGLNTFLFLWGKVRFVQTNLGWGGVQGKSARKESLRNGTPRISAEPRGNPPTWVPSPPIYPQLIFNLHLNIPEKSC